jgi:REP element-mobilizing transposase RayT
MSATVPRSPREAVTSAATRTFCCREMGVQIIEGVLSSDHIHMFVSVPPHVAISDLMQRAKGRSS